MVIPTVLVRSSCTHIVSSSPSPELHGPKSPEGSPEVALCAARWSRLGTYFSTTFQLLHRSQAYCSALGCRAGQVTAIAPLQFMQAT